MEKNDNRLIRKLFMKLLPVQVMIYVMGSVNSIVDGVIAGQFIDAKTVGVIGLYYSMVQALTAISLTLVGGSSVLCGKYIGRGEQDRTEGIFSLNITVSVIIGTVFTLLSLLIPGNIAIILGADADLKESLVKYILGYAIGIIPLILNQQLALFLQLDGNDRRGYVGVFAMILSNVSLDILFVAVLKLGIFGLALSTSLSNIVYFLILALHFFSGKSGFKYGRNRIFWEALPDLILTGFPGALLVFCIALRYVVINRVLLNFAGNDGLSAMASFNMVANLYISLCVGIGLVVRMLSSVFIGEEDRDSIKKIIRISLIRGSVIVCIMAVILAILASSFAAVFFPDRASAVYHMSYELFFIYAFCLPPILIAQINTNYLQAMGHRAFINFLSVFDGFFSVVVPSLILAPVMGARGVWISNFIGVMATIFLYPVYCCIFWKRLPASTDEWLFFKPDFGVPEENSLSISLNNMDQVARVSEKIQAFASDHYLGKKVAYYSALCFEEMAGNVIKHGFKEGKNNSLTARFIVFPGKIMLRLKDDCRPFNPKDIVKMVSDDNTDKVGIPMIYKIADDINYQNMLGLNVLSITIEENNLLEIQGTDFLLERTLEKKSPELHRRFQDTVFASSRLLSRYKLLFPEFTDHTELHSMTVIDFCNRIIGLDKIGMLNEDEIYILLTACYLHDIGMGVSEKEYESFKDEKAEKEYFSKHPNGSKADFIRDNHNEFSGAYIEKNAEFFGFPSSGHTFAIKQVARGHRRTDLYDEKEYPVDYNLDNGNTVCLPYLSAIIRLADEIDFVAARNPVLLYDVEDLTKEIEIFYGLMTQAMTSLKMTDRAFIFTARTSDEKIRNGLIDVVKKMQNTLDYCRNVINTRTKFTITQEKVDLDINELP